MANQNPVTDDDQPAHFTGEEGGEERSTPAKNLGAAGVVALLGIVAMILSAQMSVPDTLATAPGLLPFLVGAGLVLMAAGLAVKAIRAGALRGNQYRPDPGHWFSSAENRRTLLLIGIVFAYILVVDAVWFEFYIPLGFFTLPVSSFETLSTLALTIILKCFWRGSLLRCVAISALFSLALANVFRFGFVILLPGAA